MDRLQNAGEYGGTQQKYGIDKAKYDRIFTDHN